MEIDYHEGNAHIPHVIALNRNWKKEIKGGKGSHQPGRSRNPVTERVSGIIKTTLPRSTGLIAGAEDRKSWNNNTFLEANKTTHKKKPTKTK